MEPNPVTLPTQTVPTNVYPTLTIPHIQNPSRLYAFPILGFVIKAIILIPVGLWTILVSLLILGETMINAFVVLLTGKYWSAAYNNTLGYMRLSARTTAFWFGLTNKYPGFSLSNTGDVALDMPIPENPGKLYAIPFLGLLIRSILIIPYAIYTTVVAYGGYIGAFISFLPILFMGRYPESTYELARDGIRLSMGAYAYTFGFSDKYPSFYISWNHKVIKIILIILGALLFISNSISNFTEKKDEISPQDSIINQYTIPTPEAF